LRLANADVLPFEFKQWHKTVSGYLDEIMKQTKKMRVGVEKHNTMVSKNMYELAADPKKPFVKPVKKEIIPFIDFTPLQNQLAKLKTTIATYSKMDISKLSTEKLNSLNKKLMLAEHVREAVEEKNWKEAQEQISKLANTLKEFNKHLQEMATMF